MKQVITIGLILLFFTGIGMLLLSGESGTQSPADNAHDSTIAPDGAPGTTTPTVEAEPVAVRTARQRVADAEVALQTAIAQRKAAEAQLDAAEREVKELESWIDEIEARGDDPVDYADEGLEKLQPAFFAFQDASQRFELAESMEVTATEELALANAALAAALASYRTSE